MIPHLIITMRIRYLSLTPVQIEAQVKHIFSFSFSLKNEQNILLNSIKLEILKEKIFTTPNGRRSLQYFPVMKQRDPTKKRMSP